MFANPKWILVALAVSLWWRRRQVAKAPQGWVIRDVHGCHLMVLHDHDGEHFVWNGSVGKATIMTSRQTSERYLDDLNQSQAENGPFRVEPAGGGK